MPFALTKQKRRPKTYKSSEESPGRFLKKNKQIGLNYQGNLEKLDSRKCPKHLTWKRKGVCEQCRLAEEDRAKELAILSGETELKKPTVIIRKL